MVFHIKELFLEIINHCNYNFIAYIPTIVNFNRISKRHYAWMKNKQIKQIKDCMIWLNAQKLRKTINPSPGYAVNKYIIENWAGHYIEKEHVLIAVLLYNTLNMNKIIGEYGRYNICYPYMYPEEDTLRNHYGIAKSDYKNFPVIKNIIYQHKFDGFGYW